MNAKQINELHEYVSGAPFAPYTDMLSMAMQIAKGYKDKKFDVRLGLLPFTETPSLDFNPFQIAFNYENNLLSSEISFSVDAKGLISGNDKEVDMYFNLFTQAEKFFKGNKADMLLAGYKLTGIRKKGIRIDLYTCPFFEVSRSLFVYYFVQHDGSCQAGYWCFIDTSEQRPFNFPPLHNN